VAFFTSGVGVLSATHSITLAAAHTHTGSTPHVPIINPTRALNEEMMATRIFGIATNAGELGQHNRYSTGELGQHNRYSARKLGE
jgi:uncharacterized NAD-dependent epimerase/dehydratase family protein